MKKGSLRYFWSGAGVMSLIGCVCANDAATPLTEEDYFSPVPRVTSAARLEKSLLESGMSVTIIDREMIEASTAIEIPDLLRLVPGFQVAHATGVIFAAGYHGANDQWPRRMEVMVDGRSVYMNTISGVEWSALGLAIEDIERIEVVRGPNSPTFGSNAVLGSINIVTRAPFLLSGTYLRGTFGGEDTEIGVARWGGSIGGWDTSLTAQYRADDGFDGVNDHKRFRDLRFRGDYQATVADTVSVQMGMTSGEAGVDAPAEQGYDQDFDVNFDPFRDRDIRSHYQQLSWNRADEDGSAYRFNLYHQYYDHDDGYAPDLSRTGIFPAGTTLPLGLQVATSERYDVEFQHNPTPADNWRIAWGLGGRYDELSSDLMLGGRSRVERFSGRVFGSLEFKPIQDVAIALDVLTELHESHGSETSSRIGVNWLAAPQRSFRANASQSKRVFNLLERFLDYPLIDSNGINLGQLLISTLEDDFTSEEVVGYELGYTEKWDSLGLLLDVRLFLEELDDSGMGGLDPSDVVVWRDEAGGWDTTGLDVQLDYRPAPDTRFIGAYSYAEIDGKVGDRLDANGNIIRFDSLKDTAPRHTLSLLASHRLDHHWRGSLGIYYMDNVRWRGEGSEVDSYTRVDLKLARDFGFADTEGQLALIVQNLMDDEYHEFRDPDKNARDGNTFDRRVYLQLSLGFD